MRIVLIGDTRFRMDGKYAVYAKWIEENRRYLKS